MTGTRVEKDHPDQSRWLRRAKRVLAEPTFHFFVAGALLFLVHRLVVGDDRTIVVGHGLKADLARRFQDHGGRAPNPAELDTLFRDWKRDEVLEREALREGLDRNDATIRAVLADKLRARIAFEIPKREPSDTELEQWLASHRELYETAQRHECEWVTFPKAEAAAREELETYERALHAGGNPSTPSRPILGRSMSPEDLGKTFGKALAERIPALPRGSWQRLETDESLLLVRLKRSEGGLASFSELRPRLAADWTQATERQAIQEHVDRLVEHYRFEEKP